jgi:ribosomal protein S18 acetylase RimI-like enzyme
MDAVRFREEVKPADIRAVRRIVESAGLFREEEIELAVELIRESLSRGTASGYHFVFAEKKTAVVGYCCYGPIPCTARRYDLYWIAVSPDEQGKGLGTELLSFCEGKIAALGGERIYVETSSRQSYDATRKFYRKRGYHREAVLADFYAPGDSKIILVKVLGKNELPPDPLSC